MSDKFPVRKLYVKQVGFAPKASQNGYIGGVAGRASDLF
jgi:hypothetical protein